MRDETLHIIVPVFNEEKNFPDTYHEIRAHLGNEPRIIVVYDFDEDTTIPVVKELALHDPNLVLLRNTLGRGPANALKAGFASVSSGPVLVVMADMSDDMKDVPTMLALYRQGADVVCGSRYVRGGRQIGGRLLKRTLSRLAGISLYYLRGIPTHDITNNFKLYDGAMLKRITIESKMGFSIAMEITVKAFLMGKNITEVPTTWRDRTGGEAKFKLFKWLPQYLHWYFFAFRPKHVK